LPLNHSALPDEKVVAVFCLLIFTRQFAGSPIPCEEIPDFPLQANVSDEASQSVRLESRHVAGVRVSIRIAVGGVKEQCDVVAFGDNGGG